MTWTVSFPYEIFLNALIALILAMAISLVYHCYCEMGWGMHCAVFSYGTKPSKHSISEERISHSFSFNKLTINSYQFTLTLISLTTLMLFLNNI